MGRQWPFEICCSSDLRQKTLSSLSACQSSRGQTELRPCAGLSASGVGWGSGAPWAGLTRFQILCPTGLCHANYLGVDWLNWLGTEQIFLGIPDNVRLPWALNESVKSRNSTTSRLKFSCSKSDKFSCDCAAIPTPWAQLPPVVQDTFIHTHIWQS